VRTTTEFLLEDQEEFKQKLFQWVLTTFAHEIGE